MLGKKLIVYAESYLSVQNLLKSVDLSWWKNVLGSVNRAFKVSI
jgi:hypothetical protein